MIDSAIGCAALITSVVGAASEMGSVVPSEFAKLIVVRIIRVIATVFAGASTGAGTGVGTLSLRPLVTPTGCRLSKPITFPLKKAEVSALLFDTVSAEFAVLASASDHDVAPGADSRLDECAEARVADVTNALHKRHIKRLAE